MKQRLCDPLPFHVTVDGQEIKIQPFFDNVLDVLSVFDDKSMTDEEKVMHTAHLQVKKEKTLNNR